MCIFKEKRKLLGKFSIGVFGKYSACRCVHVCDRSKVTTLSLLESHSIENGIASMKRVQSRWQRFLAVTCLVIIFCIVNENGLSSAPESTNRRSSSGLKGDRTSCHKERKCRYTTRNVCGNLLSRWVKKSHPKHHCADREE